MKTLALFAVATVSLTGCAVIPYEPAPVVYAAPPVVVGPPVVVRPYYGYSGQRHWHRRWR